MLLSILCCVFNFYAQNISFVDAEFKRQVVLPNVIDIDNDGEISLTEADLVTLLPPININANLTSLSDIKHFKNLKKISINGNLFLSSPLAVDLSSNTLLEEIYINAGISGIDLTNLSLLKKLTVINTNLSLFDLSDAVLLEEIELQKVTTSLDVSKLTNLKKLKVHTYNANSIDLSNTLNLTDLHLDRVSFTVDLSANIKLERLRLAYGTYTSLDLSNNLLLRLAELSRGRISSLKLGKNTSFLGLNIYNNNLEYLDTRDAKIGALSFSNNPRIKKAFLSGYAGSVRNLSFEKCPNLKFICVQPRHVKEVRALPGQRLHYNSGFIVNADCTKNNFIAGRVRLDIDGNGCDFRDRPFTSGLNLNIFRIGGITPTTVFPDQNGYYQADLPDGSYFMFPNFQTPNPTDFSLTPPLLATQIVFPDEGPIKTIDLCVTPNVTYDDLEITMIPNGSPARPGFNTSYLIRYRNIGNTTQSGNITLDYDQDILSLVTSNPVATSSNNHFSWNFSNLAPYESRDIVLTLNVNTPTDTPAVNDGDILTYKVQINGAPTDQNPNDNIMTLNQTVVNSYDPNDKTCLEGTRLDPEDVGKYLHYLIRFENKGTANALDVNIVDKIDTTKLDIKTLVPLYASHNFRTTIQNEKEVTFTFENINLPFDDATNDGYILFKIKTLHTLKEGDVIDNTAEIYFDFNPAVITNTERVEVKKEDIPVAFEDFFTLFPNPTSDLLNITKKTDDIQIQYITIHDTADRIVAYYPAIISTFNISFLFANVYIVKVHTDKGIFTKKVVKTN